MKSTERFSDRTANYLKYRPSYPVELVDMLSQQCELREGSVIADIGSGTGKLTELLLANHYTVFGVEPNTEMRATADALFLGNESFVSMSGDSSTTGLKDHSVDLVVAAQSFHWFDKEPTKQEFTRILKPKGYIGLIWNERDTSLPFQIDYDQLLEHHCEGYAELNHRNISEQEIQRFFSPNTFELYCYPYAQTFDKTGFLGRMYSSSYTPVQGSAEAKALNTAAEALFDKYENKGRVKFSYQTKIYLSRCCG